VCVAVCATVCYRVLQCVAVCCSVLQCVAVCCSVLQCILQAPVERRECDVDIRSASAGEEEVDVCACASAAAGASAAVKFSQKSVCIHLHCKVSSKADFLRNLEQTHVQAPQTGQSVAVVSSQKSEHI